MDVGFTSLIAMAFFAGLALLALSFLLRVARFVLRLLGGLLCGGAVIAAMLLIFVLIPSMG